MPNETVFCKWMNGSFGDLQIKVDNCDVHEFTRDFVVQDLTESVKCSGSTEHFDILFDSESRGTQFEMDFDCPGRDGLFEEHRKFVVWDQQDVQGLIARLQRTLL
jgi:hypothetical protein